MTHTTILTIFRRYRNSGLWAAARLGVSKQTVSAWLLGKQTNARLNVEMPKLAAELLETKGKCMEVNGPSVRSKVGRIRGAAKRRGK